MPAYSEKRTYKLYLLYTTEYLNIYKQIKIGELLNLPLHAISRRLKNLPCCLDTIYELAEIKRLQTDLQALGIICGYDDSDYSFLLDTKPSTSKEKDNTAMQLIGIVASIFWCNNKQQAVECSIKIREAISSEFPYKKEVLQVVENEFNGCTKFDFERLKNEYK